MARMTLSMPSPGSKHDERIALRTFGAWLTTWEIYPLLLIVSFLRFYQLNTAEFDGDQAVLFRLAHDAIAHGLLPVTSNIASINSAHFPLAIYLLMIPAAFSPNPLGGVLLVAFLNVLAVLMTYIFVRRYFGRTAAVIAALFFATVSKSIIYSRFIWQPNMVTLFIILFLFPLFWGVVERRKGWLFPALFLLGAMVQLHETTILLVIPLLVAIVLAPETLRWRDLVFGLLSLLFLFFPVLLWEVSTKFADVNIILNLSKLPSHIDTAAITYYRDFFSPYDTLAPPSNPHTLLFQLIPLLVWLRRFMLILVMGGFATALLALILSFLSSKIEPQAATDSTDIARKPAFWTRLWQWWNVFRSSPECCGLLLLLVWQIVPLLVLSRHAEPIFPHYLLLLLPGPFILIGLFIAKLVDWLRTRKNWWERNARYAIYAFTGLILLTQLLGTSARIFDLTSGNSRHGYTYTTLNSLQGAVSDANQLAQQHHLNPIYIASDQFTQDAFRYLAEQMPTAVTVFDASHCLVLPNPTAGPAVLLVGPSDQLTTTLLKQYATMTLIKQPPRLGGVPFRLYIIQSRQALSTPTSSQSFMPHLQLLDSHAQLLNNNQMPLLATRWQMLYSAQPSYRTTYSYAFTASPNSNGSAALSMQSLCVATSLRAGDQLIVAFSLPQNSTTPTSLRIAATFYTVQPYTPIIQSLHLETIRDQKTTATPLQTTDGVNSILLTSS